MINVKENEILDSFDENELLRISINDIYTIRYPNHIVLQVVDAGADGCFDCAFGYDNDLYDIKCPVKVEDHEDICQIGLNGKIFKIISTEDYPPKLYHINTIKSKLCSQDICIYHREDMSCEEDESTYCMIRIIKG